MAFAPAETAGAQPRPGDSIPPVWGRSTRPFIDRRSRSAKRSERRDQVGKPCTEFVGQGVSHSNDERRDLTGAVTHDFRLLYALPDADRRNIRGFVSGAICAKPICNRRFCHRERIVWVAVVIGPAHQNSDGMGRDGDTLFNEFGFVDAIRVAGDHGTGTYSPPPRSIHSSAWSWSFHTSRSNIDTLSAISVSTFVSGGSAASACT